MFVAVQANAAWYKLPVLVYHHIQDPVKSDVSCTPKQFEEQMNAILAAGFTPLRLSQVRNYLSGILDIKSLKPVLITFDDGYESLHEFALPVSKKLKIPMTVFVVTSRIGKKPQFARYLSERQIREMADSGYWEFGSHSHDLHTDVLRIYNAFNIKSSDNPVLEMIKRDLRLSSYRLKGLLGQRPLAIAWPYGKYNNMITNVARKAGFKLHFTSNKGYNEKGGNPFAIKRIPVSSRDTAKSVLIKIKGYR